MEIYLVNMEINLLALDFNKKMFHNITEVTQMSDCRFIPLKEYDGNIKTVYFVYETELQKLSQPFIRPMFYLHLACSGTATLETAGKQHKLKKGDLFFGFPGCPYTITKDNGFDYCYISFMGASATTIITNLGITYENPVYFGFEHLIPLWLSSIKRITRSNASILTEGVLMYTLSFINNTDDSDLNTDNIPLFKSIVNYIDKHFTEPDMSLKMLSSVFSYTEKYISHLFARNMNIKFTSYLKNLRIAQSYNLIARGETSISKIAKECGFTDPLYFSKVFKTRNGISPTEYIEKFKNTAK